MREVVFEVDRAELPGEMGWPPATLALGGNGTAGTRCYHHDERIASGCILHSSVTHDLHCIASRFGHAA